MTDESVTEGTSVKDRKKMEGEKGTEPTLTIIALTNSMPSKHYPA